VRKRLVVYHQQTEPLIAYYDELGLLRRFDGTRSPNEVHATSARDRDAALEDEL
jgi:adenylate kinase